MSLIRIPAWEEELHSFLKSRRAAPFAWGRNDCSLFAADAILAMTGVDIADDFRGKYTSERSALRLIRSITGLPTTADAVAYAAAKHGLVERPHSRMAQRGDLVILRNGGTLIAGVVALNGCEVVSVAEAGSLQLPLTAVTRSWKV